MIKYKTIYNLYCDWTNNEELPLKINRYDNKEFYYRVKNDDLNYMYQNKSGHLLSFTNKDDKFRVLICYYSKDILDETEKKYLEGVIRPFRNRVRYIVKKEYYGYEYISIEYKEINNSSNYIQLPNFKPNTMYKGMEIDKEYSLKELEL